MACGRHCARRALVWPLAAAAGMAFALAAGWAGAQPVRIVDVADLGDPASRVAHGLAMVRAKLRFDRTIVGTVRRTIAGAALEPGGEVRLRLRGVAGQTPSLLVTLATGPSDYGKRQAWRLDVGGRTVCAWDDADPGGGTHRSFVADLPAPAAALDVRLVSDPSSACRVTVTSVRVYTGLAQTSPSAAALRPMAIAPLTPHGGGYTLTAAHVPELYRLVPQSPYVSRHAAVLFSFSARSAEDNAREIDRLAGVAEQTGVPLRIAFQVHWGGTPKGVPDGAGGTYCDLPYQQVTFDPANTIEAPGLRALMGDRYDQRFGLSVPNRWSDTPWLTYNHPRLNQFRRVRLTRALIAWQLARTRLAARGKAELLPPELSTGEETVYWARGVDDSAYTAANGGKPRAALMADFNPFVASDAIREGVVLDPRDGLSLRERNWLHTNLARQQQRLIDWMFTALPPEPVRLGAAGAIYAADLVRRNLYTEPYGMPMFPLAEVTPHHPNLEVGYVVDGRAGAEYWSGAVMAPWLLKQREMGRTALPNLECTGADDAQLLACLQAAYATGGRFATLYNWQHRTTTRSVLAAFAASIARPAAQVWQPAPGAPGSRTLEREWTAPQGAFAVNCVDVWASGSGGPSAWLSVELRVRPAGGGAERSATVRVPAGVPAAAVPVRTALPSLFCVAPGDRVLLRIAADGPCAVARSADGGPAARVMADIARERLRSVTLQDWHDAADILASLGAIHRYSAQSIHARLALTEARARFTAWKPREAYAAAIRAEQVSLPAPFQVPAPGARLSPYWITVDCPGGPVQAIVRTYTDQAASITVRSDVRQTVRLRWGNRQTQAALTPGVPAEVAIVLERPVPASAARQATRPARRRSVLRGAAPSSLPTAADIKRGR